MGSVRKIALGTPAVLVVDAGRTLLKLGNASVPLFHFDVELVFRSPFEAFLDRHGQSFLIASGARAMLLSVSGPCIRLLAKSGGHHHYVDCHVRGELSVEIELMDDDLWLWENDAGESYLDYSPRTLGVPESASRPDQSSKTRQ